MRLRHVEVFQAVYASGSITQAAKVLNVSQPSVSKVLAHAELQIGFPLFNRSRGKLTPTPEAVRLYDHVLEVYEGISRVRRVAGNLRRSAEGTIRIASTPALGVAVLPQLVAGFIADNPGSQFELETLHLDEIAVALKEARIDLAIAFDPEVLPGCECQSLLQGRFVLIAPPHMAGEFSGVVGLEELGDTPFVRLNTRGPLGQVLENHLADFDFAPRVAATTETYHVARSLVARGVGVAVVDEVTASSGAADDVVVVPLKPEITKTMISQNKRMSFPLCAATLVSSNT